MTVSARPAKQQKTRGRRRARMTMRILTGVCALAGLGIGAAQLTSDGLETFVDRPEGVGATPPSDSSESAAELPDAVDPPVHDAPRDEAPPRHPSPHGHGRGGGSRHHEPDAGTPLSRRRA